MPRFTLVIFDRYNVQHSRIKHYDTSTTNLERAFRESLSKLWNGEETFFESEFERIRIKDNVIGIDFEEESYLFFEN